jgi:hypothetical protein
MVTLYSAQPFVSGSISKMVRWVGSWRLRPYVCCSGASHEARDGPKSGTAIRDRDHLVLDWDKGGLRSIGRILGYRRLCDRRFRRQRSFGM